MIGIKFDKPLQLDRLTRTVTRTIEREITEQIAVPVKREETRDVQEQVAIPVIREEERIIQEPVFNYETDEYEYVEKTIIETIEDIEYQTVTKSITETVEDIEYQTVTKIVTEDVEEQEEYDNPASNTMTKYCEAAQWCNANHAVIEDKGEYYEIVALPEPTAEELAAAELKQAKVERAEAVANITVEVDGMVFDGDETAQERMARTVTAATATGASMDDTTTWVLHDNTVAQVSIRQLATALRLAGEAQTALWTVPYTSTTTTNSEQHYTLE